MNKIFTLNIGRFVKGTVCLVAFLMMSNTSIAQNIKETPFNYTPELLAAAEKGDADAMYKIGICYYVGKGGAPTLIKGEIPFEKDLDKAFDYLSKAAKKGSALAMLNLGNIYKSGVGAPKGKNLKLALEWYEKSGEEGCADAYASIAKVYETEIAGLIAERIEKFEADEAADAAYILWNKAAEYNKLAAEKGSSIGAYNLGIAYNMGLLGLAIDYQEATKWFRRSMELGNKKAINDLAVRYINGIGIPQNKRFGLELMKQAAEAEEPMALHNIGVYYYNGLYLSQDKEKALLYFLRANTLGYNNSKALSECYVAGLHGAKNFATEKDWLIALRNECNNKQLPSVVLPELQVVYTVTAGNVINDCGSWSIVDNDGVWVTDRRYDMIVKDPTTGELTAGLYGFSTQLADDGSEVSPILEQIINSLENETDNQNIMMKSDLVLKADHDNSMGYRSIAYYNYAVYWYKSSLIPFAEIYLKKALEVEPDFTAAKEYLVLLQDEQEAEKKAAKKAARKERRALIWDCIFTGFSAVSDVVGQVAANKQADNYRKEVAAEANRQKNKERKKQLKEQQKYAKQEMVGMINRRAVSNAYTENVGMLTDLKNSGQYGSQQFRQIQQQNKAMREKYGLQHHESEDW